MNRMLCWGEPRADRDRVGRGHADVAPRLYLGGGVDVAHHGEVVAVLGARGVDVCAAHHVRHGAVGRRLGEQHALVRVEQLGRLAHELDAGEHDGALRQVDGEARQGERVAHVVGEGLNLGWHVVVGEDHGVALGLEALDPVTYGGGHLGCGGELRRPERPWSAPGSSGRRSRAPIVSGCGCGACSPGVLGAAELGHRPLPTVMRAPVARAARQYRTRRGS